MYPGTRSQGNPRRGERQADRGVQMGTGHLAHEQDDPHHHEPGSDDGRRAGDGVREGFAHHPAAGGDQDQKEGAEQFGKQTTPFLLRIVKVLDRMNDVRVEPLVKAFVRVPACAHRPSKGVRNRAGD